MAIDEVLTTRGEAVLRGYFWSETSLSLGNFVSIQDAKTINNSEINLPIVRRSTGGGCVRHEKNSDFSYSLIVPKGEILGQMRPLETYRWIHEGLRDVLCESGVDAELTPVELISAGSLGRDCFRRPVAWDVMSEGRKIAGAGQKLGRWGFLHQGNLQGVPGTESLLEQLANRLSTDVIFRMEIPEEVLSEAEDLAESKYRNRDWTHKY